ncbi:MAG: alpha/beta fold hydrolase [Desulfococcaceae bacterium]|jgi:haloalkane dehalogenase|nr:alpha/beta fold hydrolase [Desulfococcaceae bacterium]
MSFKQKDISAIRHLYPFTSRFLKIRGLHYHYLDEGEGEVLLLLHGNPTWSFYFRHLVRDLSPQYRMIVPDHMGCGLSDKPGTAEYDFRLKSRTDDLESLLEHLGIREKITLVLHDWGGMIGMAYALRHPERISRLVICNTAAFFPPGRKKIPLRLAVIRNILPFAVPAVLGLNLFSRAALYMAPYRKLSPEVKKGLTLPYNCPGHRLATLKFVQDIPLHPTDSSYETARQVDENLHSFSRLPALICWGAHDFVFDRDYFDEWRRRFPHAESHYFSDAGHYILEDKAAELTILLKDFLIKHRI